MSTDSATVFIRSVGERTESLCRQIILNQGVPESNIFIVREVPFSAALKKSFEIGIELNLPWTLCVDADILLRGNAVYKLIEIANKQRENICEVQGFILDKFFGGARHGGPHLYRTSLLPKVLEVIPAEGVNIRPEHHTLNMMANMGFPWVSVTLLTGLHDFEQYNRDIFRKSIVQSHKHLNWMEVFVPYWRKMAANDYDYHVALSGLAAGIIHHGTVFINANHAIYHELFSDAITEEKDELFISNFSIDNVDRIIAEWTEPEEYIIKKPDLFNLNLRKSTSVYRENFLFDLLKRKYIELGLIKLIISLIEVSLRKISNYLNSYAEKKSF